MSEMNREGEKMPLRPSMDEKETLEFFAVIGIRQLDTSRWKPNQPVLYVLDEGTRRPPGEAGKLIPADKIASIARIDEPMVLRLYKPGSFSQRDCDGALHTNGGRVDYYAIDPHTKQSLLVGTGNPDRSKVPFLVHKKKLFEVDDTIFPKSKR